MEKTAKKLSMIPNKGALRDIHLYIIDEKTLYTKTHSHNFFEFMLITRGKLRHTINGEERILSENDVCVLRPEAVHTIKPCDDSSVVFYNFEVNIDYLRTLCQALGFNEIEDIFPHTCAYSQCSPTDSMEYIKVITIPATRTNLMRTDIKDASLKIIIAKLLMHFILNPAPLVLQKKEDSIVSTILAMLEDKDNFHLTIKELCERTFYTQEHITRLFQRAGLNTPNRIHLQMKLHYAAHLLLNSDIKIIDIADECGIETVSYLTKTFKKEYGISPSTYRKMYKRNFD